MFIFHLPLAFWTLHRGVLQAIKVLCFKKPCSYFFSTNLCFFLVPVFVNDITIHPVAQVDSLRGVSGYHWQQERSRDKTQSIQPLPSTLDLTVTSGDEDLIYLSMLVIPSWSCFQPTRSHLLLTLSVLCPNLRFPNPKHRFNGVIILPKSL